MDQPVTISYNDDPAPNSGNFVWEDPQDGADNNATSNLSNLDLGPDLDMDLLTEALFEGHNNNNGEGNSNNPDIAAMFGNVVGDDEFPPQEPGLLPGQGDSIDPPLDDDFPAVQGFGAFSNNTPPQTQVAGSPVPVSVSPMENMQEPQQPALVSSSPGAAAQQQQQQFVSIAPNFPPDQQQNAMAAAAAFMAAQQQQQSEAGGGGSDGMMGNPFLALAAAGGALPMANREQFFQAAFEQRAKTRKRQMTSEQAERRRERNRQLAKKTRDRKKNHMEALQEEVLELQRANAELKAMVRTNLDQKESETILDSCDAIDKVPQTVWEACGTDKQELAADDFDMVSSIQKSQTAFVITDPSFEDNPIVFVSPDFLTLTGYSREQVIGRNCRFLQGAHTDPDKVNMIRHAMAAGEDVGVTLINYKADGTPFWNRLFIAAVRDVNDDVVNYIGVTVRVARPEPGDPEHDKELR
mmetsp:Transcript_2319/g.6523  ORF Transcript_2319/g.6523 Transcript_2319/m.6523 type:complete len:467 (+) Transcript_2319:348-1748(+)